MISPNRNTTTRKDGHEDEAVIIERIKQKARERRLRAAQALASRMQRLPDGSLVFLRFSRGQRIQHQILIVSFTTLAITGLLQRYSQLYLVGLIINGVFGGIETLRTIHHLFALVFILEAVYHTWEIIMSWLVKRDSMAMLPTIQDLDDLVQMIKFNLNKTDRRPLFDRFSVEGKMEYWALLWGGVVMIITGIIQWFPTLITKILPGYAIPVSRAIHSWEAVLATLAILTWHLYHTVIKERNQSIFTGYMTEKELQESHPLEYRRIQGAHAYLQKIAEEGREEVFEHIQGDGQHEVAQVG